MMRLLSVSVLALAAMALSTPARAQSVSWTSFLHTGYGDDARQPYYESRRAAYDNGYREGVKEGEKHGRQRAAFNYQDERTWQRADRGYNRSFGDFERYRQQFRAGYAEGYSDAYRRYAPNYGYRNDRAVPRRDGYPGTYQSGRYGGGYGYPGQAGYGNPAFANGANDGYEKGLDDARDRRSYDPLRHKWYRSGDHDYKSQYGPRERYRDVYRQGFKEGYERGYRNGTFRR